MANNPEFFAGYAKAAASPGAGRELWLWSGLAVGSLAVAGVFALLLALSRVPGVENVLPWPIGFFDKGLVIHVVFSFVVWFLAVFGGMVQLATLRISGGAPRAKALGGPAVACAAAATVLLMAPALMDRGEATLNNYIPAITDPLYYGGLGLLGAGLGLAALRLLINVAGRTRDLDPLSFSMTAAAITYLVALICFGLSYRALDGVAPSHQFNEDLFWGGGHVLQFLNTILMVGAWYVLGQAAFKDGGPAPSFIYQVAAAMLALFTLPSIFFILKYGVDEAIYIDIFTKFQLGLGPPVFLVIAAIGIGLAERRRDGSLPWNDPAFLCLALSVFVFSVGGWLGFFVDGADTRTPAHYHGVIAGITLSMMGLFYVFFLPLLGRPVKRGKVLSAQILMFGGGQALASIGLFLAGGYGAPRKTAGAAQGLEDLGAVIGMYMNGIGALIAVIGGVMFIFTVAKALIKSPGQENA